MIRVLEQRLKDEKLIPYLKQTPRGVFFENDHIEQVAEGIADKNFSASLVESSLITASERALLEEGTSLYVGFTISGTKRFLRTPPFKYSRYIHDYKTPLNSRSLTVTKIKPFDQ